jgi:eukaryotic-like serine/threonine-protein kinase
MVARPFHCEESRLKSFLSDDLPELEHAELTAHLDDCSACRRTLDRLTAGSRLWGELAELAHTPARSMPAAGDASETGLLPARSPYGDSGERDPMLDFLGPSDVPGSLGRLGPYEVTEVLGRGGFGIVLKASDAALGRAVAIKVLAPQLATSGAARSRFAREARAAAAVVHDHVVAIHSVDSWRGMPYLVMPYVAGRSLQERVDHEGPLGPKEILRIGLQTALGLAAAHAQGLVHRDVKPSNILLENGVERVKLTDFGLARAVDDGSLTQSGVVAGTPQYMSPEQAAGETVDHRSDLFSLGSVLYFMCVGHPPFRASSTPAVLRRVCDERPTPLRDLNPELPDWLARTIERLHAKDPAARFQSSAEVAETLGRFLADLQRGVPIAAPPVTEPERTQKRSESKMSAAAALAVALPLFILAVAAVERPGLLAPLWAAVGLGGPAAPGSNTTGPRNHDQIVVLEQGDSHQMIVGSGNPASKTWDLADFTSVKVRSTFRAKITKGARFKLITTADDNIIDKVEVSKDGSTLRIGLANGNYQMETPLQAEVVLPVLTDLDISGASHGTISGFDAEKEVKLAVSGASELDGSLVAERVDFKLDGASSLSLSGSARAGRIESNGASHVKLAEFVWRECELELDGASNAMLSVRSSTPFKAEIDGASRLNGSVETSEIDLELDGASTVTLRGAAEVAKINGDGASTLKLNDFAVDSADVTLSGASSASVQVKRTLTYNLTSVSSLRYRGEPSTVKGKESGGASISHRP